MEQSAELQLGTKVAEVALKDGKPLLSIEDAETGKNKRSEPFDAVIVATSTPAMKFMQLSSLHPPSGEAVLNETVASAISDLGLINSSKLFIRTKNKFWLDEEKNPRKDIPQNIQTDQGLHGAYCLDYPGTDYGIVLLNYAWGNKSAEMQSLSKEDRLNYCKTIIKQVSPEFAENLKPVNGEIHCIDWQLEPYHHGAFKLPEPGQEQKVTDAFYQFQDKGANCFLAGDGVGYGSGWANTAAETGYQAAVAVARALGGKVPENSPLDIPKDRYNYGGVLENEKSNAQDDFDWFMVEGSDQSCLADSLAVHSHKKASKAVRFDSSLGR